MATTYTKPGRVLDWTNGTGSAVVSGQVVAYGPNGYGIATVDIANGAKGAVSIDGVHTVPKRAHESNNAIAQGQAVFFDAGSDQEAEVGAAGHVFLGFAEEAAATTATTVKVKLQGRPQGSTGATSSGTAITLTANTISPFHTIIASAAGTQAVAVPGAASVPNYTFMMRKTGTAGAVTITPAAGTIAGGATFATADAQNDWAMFTAIGADWVLVASVIA